jgi:hypothetical protein
MIKKIFNQAMSLLKVVKMPIRKRERIMYLLFLQKNNKLIYKILQNLLYPIYP